MIMMRPCGGGLFPRRFLFAVVALSSLLRPFVLSMPFQLLVNQRASECLYDELGQGELATYSLFILSGSSLRATMDIHGPLKLHNGAEIRSGQDLHEAMQKFDAGPKENTIRFSTIINFEHLNLGEPGADEMPAVTPNEDESVEARKARRAEERKKMLEQRQRKEAHDKNQKAHARAEGEPFQKTVQAPQAGWYRFCVAATWNQVTVEVDLRKESELGGIGDNGHVLTFREKVAEEEEEELEKDTAQLEGIKDEDFKGTRDKLKTLRRLLGDIQTKQSQERHRLALHAATSEHSHSRMALNSLMETVLFMAVTGYQVYTIRRWFKGAPVLGR